MTSVENKLFGSTSPFAVHYDPNHRYFDMLWPCVFLGFCTRSGQYIQCQEIRKVQNAVAHLLNCSLQFHTENHALDNHYQLSCQEHKALRVFVFVFDFS